MSSALIPASSTPQHPPQRYHDARETRSNLIAFPKMTFEGFNPQTGTFTCRFSSLEGYQKAQRATAVSMAAFGHFGMAKQAALKGGAGSSEQALDWTAKALMETAGETGKNPKDEWKAVAYQQHAQRVAEAKAEVRETFEDLIDKMKQAFSKGQFETIPENFYQACALNPRSFKPHYFSLILTQGILKLSKDHAGELVKAAYDQSPLLTFNTLINILCFCETKQTDFIDLVCSRFPDDLIFYNLINDNPTCFPSTDQTRAKQMRFRHQFCTNLAEGMAALRARDFERARQFFHESSFYHINDKRPYMYKALIDLYTQDIESAIKLITSLTQIVRWEIKEEREIAIENLLAHIKPTSTKPTPLPIRSETPVLKVLLSICNRQTHKPELDEKFSQALDAYLQQPDCDLLFASFAVDVYEHHLNTLYDQLLTPETLQFINSLNAKILFISFRNLPEAVQTEYEESLHIEEARLSITPCLTTDYENRPIFFNEESLYITDQSAIASTHDTFIDRQNAFFLNFIKLLPPKFIFALLDTKDMDLNQPQSIFSSCQAILDQKGSLEDRQNLIRWAIDNKSRLDTQAQNGLTQLFFKWELETSFGQRATLTAQTDKWLKAIDYHFTGSPVERARLGWHLIQEKKIDEAFALIQPFFECWEDYLSHSSIDASTVKTLCIIKALVENQQIAQHLPFGITDSIHLELIHSALTLLARKAVPFPYVVPHGIVTKKQLKGLVDQYVGARLNETELERLKRQQALKVPNLNDLRQAHRITDFFASEPDNKTWVLPPEPKSIQLINALIDEHTALTQARCAHNQQITEQEKPKTAEHQLFLTWMKAHPTIVQDYIKNQAQVITAFKQAHPSIQKKAIGDFESILDAKAAYEKKIEAIKPTNLSKIPGVAFWELVKEAAHLIHTVMDYTHTEKEYALILETQQEAHTVQQLIQEWSFKQPMRDLDELNENFHGPETHFTGQAPFIPHFNAGVINNRSPSNVHLFFKNPD